MLKLIRPLLTLTGLVITGECLSLILQGKINFGTVVPAAIGATFIVHGLYWPTTQRWLKQHPRWQILWQGAWAGFGVWLISFGAFVIVLKQQIKLSQQQTPHVAAVIILGSGTVEGEPSPTLAKRLDAAVPIIRKQPNATVITSGGIGFGHTRSEADIMATYLAKTHNIPRSRIIEEGASTSTEENLVNSKPLLQAHGVSISDPIAITTSDFHTVRARAIAKRYGYQNPIMVASSTPLSIRYNAWFREYFAFVSGWLLDEY